ncbi:hypothetical protein [Archangium sp.]|uniref:hypothetical protein n=1 Tax=Archangium sp. TaxID=1872627 RepID=UPI002ED93CE2
MAKQDRRPPPQPAEDMFGRPTDVRHDEPEPDNQPTREQQGAHQRPERDPDDENRRHARAEADEEIACGGVGEIPDGDGIRSERGTNPLPDCYWSYYQGKKPDEG